jgi:translation initiation factor 1
MKSGANRGGLVYSTDSGRMCPECRHPLAACVCRAAPPASVGDGVAKVMREKKGRAGKTVTVVRNLALDPVALAVLARELKNACGSGGTLRDGVLEIQGDHVERVLQALESRGLKAKRAGG